MRTAEQAAFLSQKKKKIGVQSQTDARGGSQQWRRGATALQFALAGREIEQSPSHSHLVGEWQGAWPYYGWALGRIGASRTHHWTRVRR